MSFWTQFFQAIKFLILAIISYFISKQLDANHGTTFLIWYCIIIISLLILFDYLIYYFGISLRSPFVKNDLRAVAIIVLRAGYAEIKFLSLLRKVQNLQFRLNIMIKDKKFGFINTGLRMYSCYPYGNYEPEEKNWHFKKNEGVVGWCFENRENRIVDVSNSDWMTRLHGATLDQDKVNFPKIKEIKWICSKIVIVKEKNFGIITMDSSTSLPIVSNKQNGDPVFHSQEFITDIENVMQLLAEMLEYVFSGDSVSLKNSLERRGFSGS